MDLAIFCGVGRGEALGNGGRKGSGLERPAEGGFREGGGAQRPRDAAGEGQHHLNGSSDELKGGIRTP